jgi:hypothetical protein
MGVVLVYRKPSDLFGSPTVLAQRLAFERLQRRKNVVWADTEQILAVRSKNIDPRPQLATELGPDAEGFVPVRLVSQSGPRVGLDKETDRMLANRSHLQRTCSRKCSLIAATWL